MKAELVEENNEAEAAFAQALMEWTDKVPAVDVQAARFFFYEGTSHGVKVLGAELRSVNEEQS